MQTQKVNIDGLVVWITILNPVFEIEGKTYQSSKSVCYYNFYEPTNNYYGKLLSSTTYLSPLICDDMEMAIFLVKNELTGWINNMRC